jgi:hypothetical protein
MYKLLISLLSCQSIPFSFRICINLVQLTQWNAFCQSMKQIQLRIYLQSLFWYYSHNPNCITGSFSSSKSKLIFSMYIVNFPFNRSSKVLYYYLCCMCTSLTCSIKCNAGRALCITSANAYWSCRKTNILYIQACYMSSSLILVKCEVESVYWHPDTKINWVMF